MGLGVQMRNPLAGHERRIHMCDLPIEIWDGVS